MTPLHRKNLLISRFEYIKLSEPDPILQIATVCAENSLKPRCTKATRLQNERKWSLEPDITADFGTMESMHVPVGYRILQALGYRKVKFGEACSTKIPLFIKIFV